MKLKSIPDNPVVHTPTEAEAKELLAILHKGGYKWRGGTSLTQTFWSYNKANTCYRITECIGCCYRDWYESKGNPILTLAEFKERYCEEEKPQPKFKDGDIVLYKGKRKLVYNINTTLSEPIYTLTTLNYQSPIQIEEHNITPYTEPETKTTEENPFQIGDGVMFADECADNNIHIVEEIEGMDIIIDNGKVYPSEMFILFERKNEKSVEKIKLKPIPRNTVVRTPTKEEANELLKILHENGCKWCGGASLMETTEWDDYEVATCYYISSDVEYGNIHEYNIDKGHILTLAQFKQKYVSSIDDNSINPDEKGLRPKFEVGDWVIHNHKNREVGQIAACFMDAECRYSVCFGEEYHIMAEHQLLPYAESKTKPTKDMGENKEIDKDLNLCNLLRGHEGEEIFLTTMGTVIVDGISEENIRFKIHKTAKDTYLLPSNGKMRNSGMVLAFPSYTLYEKYPLDAYTAWMEWNKEQKKYVLAIVYNCPEKDSAESIKHLSFRTPADRDKAISEINTIIEKYNK